MQENNIHKGRLKIQITFGGNCVSGQGRPVWDFLYRSTKNTLEMVSTDSSGQTQTLELAAPPVDTASLNGRRNSRTPSIRWK